MKKNHIIICICLAAIAGLVFFVYKNKSTQKKATATQTVGDVETVISEIDDETAKETEETLKPVLTKPSIIEKPTRATRTITKL
ncbi:MAG: hypothetical protein PHH23_06710 [Paludibacteraceae bacterium]|nr:hypothetical protein [Paludibacteraceae bacterium]